MIYWVIHIAVLTLLAWIGYSKLKVELPGYVFWLGLILKLSAGIVLGLIFYNYYGAGDTINFFEAAKDSSNLTPSNQPRTQFFIELLAPLVKSTGGSYWISSLWISFASFMACWYSIYLLTRIYPSIKKLIIFSFLFIPSIIFWSSGIIKDSLAFGAMTLLVSLLIHTYKGKGISPIHLLLMIISAFLLLKIKHYLLITTLLFGGILMFYYLARKLSGKLKWTIAVSVLAIAIFSTQFIHPFLRVDRVANTLYENNKAIKSKTDREDELDIFIEDNSWVAILKEVPKALHAGLFRPSVLDHTPAWGWIHKAENLTITILLFLSLLLCIRLKPGIDRPLLLAACAGILLLAVMLPLSTPNFGTLVRYKNAYMPWLFLIVSALPYRFLTSQREE